MFERFKNYLDGDFSDDYWSDEALGLAATFAQSFASEDWAALKAKVEEGLDDRWLARCAEVLGDVATPMAVGILIRMLSHASAEVLVCAADSLHSLALQGVDFSDHKLAISRALKTAAQVDSPLGRDLLARLNQRISG